MKQKQWNDALNRIDPTLVEEYVEQEMLLAKRKQQRRRRTRLASLIAAILTFSVALTSGVIWASNRSKDPSSTTGNENPPTVSGSFCGFPDLQKEVEGIGSNRPQYVGDFSLPSARDDNEKQLSFAGISVLARCQEILPDTYVFYDDSEQTEFRLLRMETVELLGGLKMTEEFYYIIPVEYMTDYSLYHTFLICNMAQYSYEYFVLHNVTQDHAQRFHSVLFGYLNISFRDLGPYFLAFDENGNFDVSLWTSTESWEKETKTAREWNPDLTTLDSWKSHYYLDFLKEFEVNLLKEHMTEDEKKMLAYYTSEENGLFVPSYYGWHLYLSPKVQIHFTRYIDGYPTNEINTIYGNKSNTLYIRTSFTQDDLQRLPDLDAAMAQVMQSFQSGQILPPHIEPYAEIMELKDYSIRGWYAKTSKTVLGIVCVRFLFETEERSYVDDAYFIMEYGSDTCTQIDRDELLRRMSGYNTTGIYQGLYDECGMIIKQPSKEDYSR